MLYSAGMVVVRKDRNGTWRYLFLRAYNNWDFPKGVVEKGERFFETAIREVREETSITTLAFPWGWTYKETHPYQTGKEKKIARYYLALSEQEEIVLPVNPKLGRPEHHEYRWVTMDELKELAPQRLQGVIEWIEEQVEEEEFATE